MSDDLDDLDDLRAQSLAQWYALELAREGSGGDGE